MLYKNYQTARLSTRDKCSNCGHMVSMICDGQQSCVRCGVWFNSPTPVLPFVVARAVDILMDCDFRNTEFKEEPAPDSQPRRCGITGEVSVLSPDPYAHKRLDFDYRDNWRGCAASLRWFETGDERSYQYLNKVSKGKALNGGHVPGPISKAAIALTKRDQAPGALRISDANVNRDYAGRKFIRFEQAYAADVGPHSVLKSLTVRAELSWDHELGGGIQPPFPWSRSQD
jgi:hypothetical protein